MSFLTRLTLYLDAAETFWQDWVVTYDIARQGSLAGRVEQGAHRLGIRWFDSASTIGAWWTRWVAPAARRYGRWVTALAALAVLMWFGAGPLWRRLHWRKRVARVRRGEANVADATLLYQRMLQLLKRRGYQKPPWFTPAEFARSLPATALGVAVAEFTARYNALRFGAHAESASRLSELIEQLERAPVE
jgi:hypothetical protein